MSDLEVADRAARALTERGSAPARFVDLAAATGLAPATLVQRFGTLEALHDAVAERLGAGLAGMFAASGGPILGRLVSGLLRLLDAGHHRYLLTRPAAAAAYSLELRKQIAFLLAAAIEAGELPHCDVAHQARRVQLAFYGAATAASLEGGSGRDELTREVGEVLGDFL